MSDEKTSPRIATPIQTMGTIRRVIEGLYRYKKTAKGTEFSTHVGMHYSEVGKALGDARSLGLVADGEEYGSFILTDEGRKFAILLGHEKDDECGQLLAELILSSPEWIEIVLFLKERIGQPFDIADLVVHVEQKHDKSWSSGRRKKAERAYRTILSFANIVRIEGGMLVPTSILDDSHQSEQITIDSIDTGLAHTLHASFRSLQSTLTKTKNPDYAEVTIPKLFTLSVNMSREAVEYVREQLSKESMLNVWLDEIESCLESESEID